MEPHIRFCTTRDGVGVAYWTLGEGPTLVHLVHGVVSHIAMEWQQPEIRQWYEKAASEFQLVRYDMRGFGSSQRDVGSLSLDTLVADIEGVVDALGAEKCVLFGALTQGAVAVAYAARHPERVSHLILWNAWLRSGSDARSPAADAITSVAERDWRVFTDAWAQSQWGWDNADQARRWARMVYDSTSPTTFLMASDLRLDASEFCSSVSTPTLVVRHRDWKQYPAAQARLLASSIAGARLIELEGRWVAPWTHTSSAEQAMQVIVPFVTQNRVVSAGPGVSSLPTTAIIFFADIVDSTALTEAIGDAPFRERARALDRSLRQIIADAGGAAIDGKLLGDGVLATFPAAARAIVAALRCAASGDELGLQIHVGIHAGDVIREHDNVYGGAVNVASRISGLSAPGEVLVSDVVRALARTSAAVRFEDRGEHPLKGVSEPQRVYAVRPNP